jgi:hypothetical protein
MLKFKQYIVITALTTFIGNASLQAFNQQATEQLRQAIVEGHPDKVKTIMADGADINARLDADKETMAMLALREYMKVQDEGIRAGNPWNIAISSGVFGTKFGLVASLLGVVVKFGTSDQQTKIVAGKVSLAGMMTVLVSIPFMVAVALLQAKMSEWGKRGIIFMMIVDDSSIDFYIKNNKGQTLLDVYHTYAQDMIGDSSKQRAYDILETYIKKSMEKQAKMKRMLYAIDSMKQGICWTPITFTPMTEQITKEFHDRPDSF